MIDRTSMTGASGSVSGLAMIVVMAMIGRAVVELGSSPSANNAPSNASIWAAVGVSVGAPTRTGFRSNGTSSCSALCRPSRMVSPGASMA